MSESNLIRVFDDTYLAAGPERLAAFRNFMTAPGLPTSPRGRFAPSPSGRMHLGNLFAAWCSWYSAKRRGGKWILRIEDLDPQRCREEYARQLEDDLAWLGLDWDEGGYDAVCPDGSPHRQSLRGHIYAQDLERLLKSGYVYPCRCTRAEIMASSAPHQSDGRVIYGGTCRPSSLPDFTPFPVDGTAAARLYVPSEEITFTDGICGPQHINLQEECGDFILRRRDGAWAYQLAVVADDARMAVDEVVRGDDLLLSAAQQIRLYRLLGYTPPRFAHIPLIINSNGQRLSKRDKSLSAEELRKRISPSDLLAIFRHIAGIE